MMRRKFCISGERLHKLSPKDNVEKGPMGLGITRRWRQTNKGLILATDQTRMEHRLGDGYFSQRAAGKGCLAKALRRNGGAQPAGGMLALRDRGHGCLWEYQAKRIAFVDVAGGEVPGVDGVTLIVG
ncbi:MAG: hypothetical protein JWO95_250, partial [Verrucomicrobiales bacterium]|nr:hypothetical protein [Verrucomicrobiales bacterium]